ncbi:MAG: hypothetical protein D6693_04185, partial [Planctomycetota bacterium]
MPARVSAAGPPAAVTRIQFDGDGVEDLRLIAPLDEAGRVAESVYSGRTGRLLRRRVFIPEPTPDLDGDGMVGAADLSRLISRLGRSSGRNATYQSGDLNKDGVVGSADIAVLLNAFGSSVTPQGAAAMVGGRVGGGCLEECPDGRLARCGSCGLDLGGGGDGTGVVDDPCLDPANIDDPLCAGAG